MSQEIWRSLFRECLNGRGAQYCDEVAPLLVAVDQGVKPSLLWDVCTADTSGLLSLLNQAQAKGLLVSKLALVELDLDVLIVNVDVVMQTLSSIATSNPTWLIDISEATPKVSNGENHQKFRVHLSSIISQLGVTVSDSLGEASGGSSSMEAQSTSTTNTTEVSSHCSTSDSSVRVKAIQVKLPGDVNLSTVFGCMLGYPHIYWWEGDSDGKSLSGVPLKVFKFSADCSVDGSAVELFSFSIPEAMESELRPGIERWGNLMNVKVEEASSFSNAKFKCDSVLCLSVAL